MAEQRPAEGFPGTVLQAPDIIGESIQMDALDARMQSASARQMPDVKRQEAKGYTGIESPISNGFRNILDEYTRYTVENAESIHRDSGLYDPNAAYGFRQRENMLDGLVDLDTTIGNQMSDFQSKIKDGYQVVDPDYVEEWQRYTDRFNQTARYSPDGSSVYFLNEQGEYEPVDWDKLKFEPELYKPIEWRDKSTERVKASISTVMENGNTTISQVVPKLEQMKSGWLARVQNPSYMLDEGIITDYLVEYGYVDRPSEVTQEDILAVKNAPGAYDQVLQWGWDKAKDIVLGEFGFRYGRQEDEDGNGFSLNIGGGSYTNQNRYVPSLNKEKAEDLRLGTPQGSVGIPMDDLNVINFRSTGGGATPYVDFPINDIELQYFDEESGKMVDIRESRTLSSGEIRPQKVIALNNGDYEVVSSVKYVDSEVGDRVITNARFILNSSNKRPFEERFMPMDESGNIMTIEEFMGQHNQQGAILD